jgi:predicted porin
MQKRKTIGMKQKQLALLCAAAFGAAGFGVAGTASAQATSGGNFLERKPGDGFTLITRGGEISIYGMLDVSVDDTTKGLGNVKLDGASPPVGNTGWMVAISSNLSYLGVRGFQGVSDSTKFVYQLETQIDVSNTPGTANTNSNTSSQVKGALVSRNSFIGISDAFGAVKIGKTDAPYKTSTARMNPFSGMIGDYQVIMSNTGGDNRVEFGTRLSHAVWYESPDLAGLRFNVLVSPGQNRANDNSNVPSGDPDCAGGNIPGSGGLPVACNDGSYGNAYSTNLSYEVGGLYVTAAYELHKKVNRTSDLPTFNPLDVADEDAGKIGLQYKLGTGTTLSAIYEKMRRKIDPSLADQNERQRTGYWLAASQQIGSADSLHLGWAHANRAQGELGQHNPDPTKADANGFFPGADNSANMFTGAWKHQIDKNLNWYFTYATTLNARFAHYDLGAGGRSVTTDCHDAANPDASGFDPNGGAPHCYTGAHLQGVSIGMHYTF